MGKRVGRQRQDDAADPPVPRATTILTRPNDGWFYLVGAEAIGPFSELEMALRAAKGSLQPDDLLWKPGLDGWKPASDFFIFPPRPKRKPDSRPSPKPERPKKRALTEGIPLWIPLLILGVLTVLLVIALFVLLVLHLAGYRG